MKTKLALAAVLLVAIGMTFLYVQTSADRKRIESELATARAEAERLRSEADELNKQRLPETELARLKADQSDAIKLRGEVSNLKQTLATAQKSIADAQRAAADRKQSQQAAAASAVPEANPEFRVHTTKAHALLPAGHALAIGGWQSAPGQRSFALVVPQETPAAGQPIKITSRWIELTDAAAAQLQLDTMVQSNGNASSLLTPERLLEFLKRVETTEGAKIVSSPTVITFPGNEAKVSVTTRAETANGPVDLGPQIQITPNLTPDGGAIDLAVNATLTVSAKDSQTN
jgi:hypothetical protein